MERRLNDEEKIKEFQQSIIAWFLREGDYFPWRNLQQKKANPWLVAVGEILLNRVSAERVFPVFNTITRKYPSSCALYKAPTEELEALMEPLGLQRKKAVLLKEVSRIFCEVSNPTEVIRLLKEIKGIGKNTYNAMLLFGFEKKAFLMDGVIGRVLGRVFGKKWKGKAVTDKEAWKLSQIVSKDLSVEETKYLYYGILDNGRKICKRNSPLCSNCPVIGVCSFRQMP